MIAVRKSDDRGKADHGWLYSNHTFSFADYYDPRHMGFSSLRVINEDTVQPGGGFGAHSHRDMEIISYVLEGALEHKDSMGTGAIIRHGDVQRMSAGVGITHSEYNASKTELVHFLQIWIVPDAIGIPPSYEQRYFSDEDKQGLLRLVASPDGREGSVTIHQDAYLYATLLSPNDGVVYPLAAGRKAYVQVARGAVELNGRILLVGDGASIENESRIGLIGETESEVLLFDLH